MGETHSPSVAHVGYDISPLSRVKFKTLTTRLTQYIKTLLSTVLSYKEKFHWNWDIKIKLSLFLTIDSNLIQRGYSLFCLHAELRKLDLVFGKSSEIRDNRITIALTFKVKWYPFILNMENIIQHLPPVVCRRALTYVICVCLGIVVSNTNCVVFLFCLS